MSKPESDVDPVRRRTGFLSALSKAYTAVFRLIDTEGTTDDALKLQQKLHDRYTAYLENHEDALVAVPERESSLNASHVDVDQRHQEAVDQLQAYIDDGTRTERSLHVRSLFSSSASNAGTLKTTSKKESSRRSSCSHVSKGDRLSEARVQAELAKKNVEQQRVLQEAQQRKLAVERETTRQRLEFERQAAERKAELDQQAHPEAARRQLELEEQARQRRLLQDEKKKSRLDDKWQSMKNFKLKSRSESGKNCVQPWGGSDEERDDVTRCKPVKNANLGFQPIDEQQTSMLKILESYAKPNVPTKKLPPRAANNTQKHRR